MALTAVPARATRVGMTKPLRIAIAGLGTVGAAVFRILAERRDQIAAQTGRAIEVAAVSARDRTKDRGIDLAGVQWFDDPAAMAAAPGIDVLVELIGGAGDPAKAAVAAAISSAKHVVTANKALLAVEGLSFARSAEARGLALSFEPSAGGAIPVVKALREAMAASEITRVSGILNGTCNYILSRMEAEGMPFAEVLADAQKLGYAEADPAADVDGHDTAHKVALLCALAFGTEVDASAIYVEGISNITPLDLAMADELGFRIKLLGVAERTAAGIEQRVHPTFVPKTSQLAQVMGVTNAVSILGSAFGELTFVGAGAGGNATASAVIADLTDIAMGKIIPAFGRPAAKLEKLVQAPMQRHEGGYYIRLQVLDRPGAAAVIAQRMADQGISLESILQKGRAVNRLPPADRQPISAQRNGKPAADLRTSVPVILITYATAESTVREALDAIARAGVIDGAPQVIRIER